MSFDKYFAVKWLINLLFILLRMAVEFAVVVMSVVEIKKEPKLLF
ncbi:MAG: hypothetical protein V7752_03130 [Halopseudomonas sp.]